MTTATSIVAYSRAADGTLTAVGEFPTGGQGGDFDGPEGLDPLISAYALINTPDNEYLMAVNAGSDTITVMQINEDMSLTVTSSVVSLIRKAQFTVIHLATAISQQSRVLYVNLTTALQQFDFHPMVVHF